MIKDNGGLLWITGFSGAGKTTVAHLVTAKLKNQGIPVVMMDGDELRSILGNHFSHSKEDRSKLASIYARLCKKIADNGVTVVIATVAMFEAVRKENRLANSRYLEVYLEVPLEIRRKRDFKGIYKSIDNNDDDPSLGKGMEVPAHPDLVIHNYGQVSPESASAEIVSRYSEMLCSQVQAVESTEFPREDIKSRVEYWDSYYRKRKAPIAPSSFAIFCNESYLEPNWKILEFGCGNGRDAFYFAKTNIVTAIDESQVVVEANSSRALQEGFSTIRFMRGHFGEEMQGLPDALDAVYARFVIHAMPEESETKALKKSWELLKKNGLLLLEFRTNKDPLMNKGEAISSSERITDHYRRFIDFSTFCEKLNKIGFEVEYSVEKQGLAAHGKDDPVVARVVARKLVT